MPSQKSVEVDGDVLLKEGEGWVLCFCLLGKDEVALGYEELIGCRRYSKNKPKMSFKQAGLTKTLFSGSETGKVGQKPDNREPLNFSSKL